MSAREGKVEEAEADRDGNRQHKRKSQASVAATEEHVAHCYDAIVAHFKGHAPPKETFDVQGKHPLFVTWKKYDHRKNLTLRGCIGNLSPIPLTKIKEYALTSALRDRRFAPMDPSELPHTHCGVSLLVNYEEGRSWSDFEIGKHGMIIEFAFDDGSEFSATYLPEVAKEQRWNHQETIDSLIRKAGYRGRINGRVREAIRLTRYQSSKAALTYDQWLAMRGYDKPPL